MAATVTFSHPEPGITVIDIAETAVAAGTVVTIGDARDEKVPRIGRIMRLVCVLQSGTGTTVTPVLSSESGVFDGAQVAISATAAAAVDEVQQDGVPYAAPDGLFYHRSTPNAASDNVVATRYIIKHGI
jgi:hypothetical protein